VTELVQDLHNHLNKRSVHYSEERCREIEKLVAQIVETSSKLSRAALLNVLYLKFEDVNRRHSTSQVPLTFINRQHIYDIVTAGTKAKFSSVSGGSDVQETRSVKVPIRLSPTFVDKKMQKTRNTHSGGYWPYTVRKEYWPIYDRMPHIFKDLQVYKTPLIDKPETLKNGDTLDPSTYLDDNTPCFSHTIGPEYTERLGDFARRRRIPRSSLTHIAADVQRNFQIHYVKTEGEKEKIATQWVPERKRDRFPDDQTLELCLYKDHYFKHYPVPLARCAVTRPDEMLRAITQKGVRDLSTLNKYTAKRGLHHDKSKAAPQYTTIAMLHDMMQAGWFEKIGFNENAMSFIDHNDETFLLQPEHFGESSSKYMVASRHNGKPVTDTTPLDDAETRRKHIKVSMDIESGIDVQHGEEGPKWKDRQQPIMIGVSRETEDFDKPETKIFRLRKPRTQKECDLHFKDLVRRVLNHLAFRDTEPTETWTNAEGEEEPKWIPLTPKEKKRKVFVYIHNLKYDLHVLLPYFPNKGVRFVKSVIKDGAYYTFTISFGGRTIVFVDSYKMITMPLSKFGKAYNLSQSKDICPYKLYRGANVYRDEVPVSEVLPEHFNTPAEYTQMLERLEGQSTFRLMDYLEEYLILDCEVLLKGLRVHDNSLKEIVKEVVAQSDVADINPEFYRKCNYMDTLGCFTSASFAHNVMLLSGAYNNHCAYSGPLREWLDKGVVGGRCTLACDSTTNQPIRHTTTSDGEVSVATNTHTHSGTIQTSKGSKPYTNTAAVVHHTGFKLIDLDACSLYPSAMAALTSFPTGKPTLYTGHALSGLQVMPHYVAEVKLNRRQARTFYDIPLICYSKRGILHWFNELPAEDADTTFVLDKTTFEDLASHNVFKTEDFDFIQGVYWEQNDSRVLEKTIRYLYNRRVVVKREMKQCTDVERKAALDGLQNGIKLIMNSCYGKLGMKSSDYKTIYKNYRNADGTLHKDYLNYITKKRESVKEIVEVSGGMTVKIKVYQDKYASFNSSHLSQCILAQSKVIMNRITCLFPRDQIVYTDTDSVQTNLDAFTEAISQFKALYGYDLEGGDMGQFHPDIDDYDGVAVTYCGQGVYVAKKCYVADKRNQDNQHLDPHHPSRYHIRFKGVPGREVAKLEHPIAVYTKMATGGFAPAPNVVGMDENDSPILEYSQCLKFDFFKMDFAPNSVVTAGTMTRMFRG
jgi:hypothetical protein